MKESRLASNNLPPSGTRAHGHLPPRRFPQTRMLRPWPRTLYNVVVLLVLVGWPTLFYLLNLANPSRRDRYDQRYCIERGFFAISLFIKPDLSYSAAKAIDLGWNVIFGRGVQGALAAVLFSTAKSTLLRIAERTPVSYSFFATVSFYPTSTTSLLPLAKAVFRGRGWRLKMAAMWMAASCAFVLAIPTLFDAMTGYVAPQDAILELSDSSLIMMGDRDRYREAPYGSLITEPEQNQTTGVWLLPPGYTSNPRHIRCSPAAAQLYNWGFSPGIAFFTSLMSIFWGIGTWCLWLDARRNSQMDLKGRRMNVYTAVSDLAEAIKFELGDNVAAYSGKEIKKQLKTRPLIMYTAEESNTGLTRIRLSSREGRSLKMSFDETYG